MSSDAILKQSIESENVNQRDFGEDNILQFVKDEPDFEKIVIKTEFADVEMIPSDIVAVKLEKTKK